ncbi:uncharacterized protein LOC124279989 [Haliotis rubra]|uniref:uncharacterized protein LOC124279989 n=1 Tax=Haliotis rubra TaxID=36100 RepID=UPI001EE5F4A3|nr:uncharacterized protein LOC124279989 [Haliotis rubra]
MCMVGQNKPRNISTRPCTVLDLISECNVTGIWQEYNSDIEAACHAYTHVFRDYYRNVFCYICNENEIQLESIPMGGNRGGPIGGYVDAPFVSFAAILQFEEESDVESSSGEECSKGEYDDIFTNQCLAILCPSFYQLYQKECTLPTGLFDRNMSLYYVVELHLLPTYIDHLHLRKGSLDLLSGVLRDSYKQQGTLNSWHLEKLIVSMYRENSSLANEIMNEEHTHVRHEENDAVASEDGRHENISQSPDQYVISRIDIELYASYSSGDSADFFESLSNLLFKEFSVSVEGLEDLGSRYEELMEEKLSSIEQGYDVLTILTAVCLVFSMFFLLLSFSVYALIPELRTLPGCNLMFLISSLFLAQGLFLFGAGAVSNRVICKILGVVIHYFWMVTFAWMNVCTFHVFRVFRNILSSVKLSNDKRIILLKYGTFSYVMPAGIVAVTILANYFLSGISTIGYSDSRATCFLNPGVITLVAFGVPAVVTVVCTGAFFVCTVVALRRASAERASVGKKETKVILNLVKLSSVTGLSWVFGLLGSLFSIEAFKYVFVVLAAGQGVLIFLSFVLNKRVFKLLLGRCCPNQREKRDRSTSYTTCGTSNISSD